MREFASYRLAEILFCAPSTSGQSAMDSELKLTSKIFIQSINLISKDGRRVQLEEEFTIGRGVCGIIGRRYLALETNTLILFYKQPLFLAEPGRAYENPKFEPQAC